VSVHHCNSYLSHFPEIPGKNEKNGSFSSLGNTGTKIKAKDQKMMYITYVNGK